MDPIQLGMVACWIIFVLYWFISAQSVKSIQKTRGWLGGNWYAIVYVIGYLFIANSKFLGRIGIPTKTLALPLIAQTIFVSMLVLILLIAGLVIAIAARSTLAGNWSNAVALKENHELITTGPYEYVRHPIYTGMLMMFLGTALLYGTVGAAIGYLIILVGILLKLKEEEALMMEHFAHEYASYKKRTKMLIPFLW